MGCAPPDTRLQCIRYKTGNRSQNQRLESFNIMVSDDDPERGHGVRFELRLRTSDEHSASYSLALHASESEWLGDVDLTPPAGEVHFRFGTAAQPPAAILAMVRAQLRTIYREHERSGFPRRVTRWRPLPTGSERA